MTNAKSTKKALVASILSLCMCFSMLLGTTFAWFTDSVTSANNIITAGNLDVELEYKKVENGAIPADWAKVSNGALFDENTLWEPGHAEVVYLKVSNVGTLDLKYQLSVNIDEETPGVNVEGNPFKLSDHLVFKVVELTAEPTTNYDAREDVIDATDALGLKNYNGKTTALADGEVNYVALIVYMPETVGNEANYRLDSANTVAPFINLGVNLVATQYNSESDSFGNDYDEDAVYADKTYIFGETGNETLSNVLANINSAQDKTVLIQANGNMEWATGAEHGSTPWVKENAVVENLILDAAGATITATGSGVGPIRMANGGTLTIKNAKIVDNSVSYAEGSWEFGYLEFAGNIVFENCEFVNAISIDGESVIFKNCSFNSNADNEYAVWVSNGNATFTECTFTGPRGLKTHEAYGSEVGTIIVDNCTFDNISKKPGMAIGTVNSDTTITIKNSDFINCQAGDQGLYIYETDTDVTTFTFTEDNNTVYKNAKFVGTVADLLALSAKALTGNNGEAEEATIIITNDIDMAGADFSAIIAQRGDKLTVIGNGHTISNVNIVSGADDNTTGQASMFYAYPNSTLTVSDLTLKDITVTAEANGTGYAAAIVGYCEGAAILNNVDVVNATVIGVKSSGMLVGHLSGSLTATGCDVAGTVTLADFAEEAAGHYAGKYVGTLAGAMKAENCKVNVTVDGNLNSANIGDIYGRKVSGSSNVESVKDQTALNTAISNGATTVVLGSGNYIIPAAAQGKTLTFVGSGDTSVAVTKVGTGGENCDYGLDGSTVVFENITITTNSSTYIGYARCNATYNNCTINGTYTLYGNSVFNDCTFNVTGDVYNIWTWGAPTAEFNNCTFNSDGKALLLYGTANTKLTVNDCTFNDKGGLADLKAAIEIGNDYNKSYELIVNNTTVNGYEINDKGINTGTTLWANKNSMGTDKLNVVVDGVDVY